MKIQGPHPSLHTYKQVQQQQITNKHEQKKDQLNISDAAKKMQKSEHVDTKRARYISDIKELVQSGEYKVEPEKIAEKMVDFWS